ncbi:rifin PIR protein, putative [Plasmodium reichenowi]|uniref:Rifin PIR protein, putative n=1 Tax=Plasmodium reichenowi TaxID=5854 RepID=A0A2P9DSA8_PLARE|nr:rifin PIR protein, putative [Plasmodium reichenowi]
MKVHYINILLFALALNILVNNERNNNITTFDTQHTQTNRSLCELYAPANYDNDPQMKEVMQQFVARTSQRLREYDERMVEKRKQCKDRCDKEIQKIILKDKLEKQMEQQLTTLDTNITTEDIPTCICEKSMADKTEKFCLNCGKTMGGVAYGWGLVGGLMYTAWTNYVPIAVAKAAMDAGMNVVINVLETLGAEKSTAVILKEISSTGQYANIRNFADIIRKELEATCAATSSSAGAKQAMGAQICMSVKNDTTGGTIAKKVVSNALETIAEKAPKTAKAAEGIEAANYASTTSSLTTGITASILAIEVIVLIMLIIYLILRYRRKKKMKKKLQYIKLLKE